MRIIKDGKIPKPKTYRITCDCCGAVYEMDEIEFRYNSYLGDTYSECPVCKYFNDKGFAEEVFDNDNISSFKEVECKCPKCGAERIYKNISEALTSLPLQYYYKCKKCDWKSIGY